MKRKKKVRDGIEVYLSSAQKADSQNASNHTYPSSIDELRTIKYLPQKQTSHFLLMIVQLLAVCFFVFSWWQSLTSVLPIETDTIRLYLFCFLFTAIFVLLWNAPLRAVRKGILFLLLLCLAGAYIRLHLDAAVNVLNLTANAYLSVKNPDAYPYPIQPVPELEMAFMFAIFLLPLLFIWSLILHIRKGKLFAFLLLLAPAAFALIIAEVPSEVSCWLLILSGSVYASVCGCQEGRAALFKGLSAAAILALLVLLSASLSRPLEEYKQPADGFYARTRDSIKTGWIQPLQDSYEQAKAERNTRSRTSQKNDAALENEAPAENEAESEQSQNIEDAPTPEEEANPENILNQDNTSIQDNALNQDNTLTQNNGLSLVFPDNPFEQSDQSRNPFDSPSESSGSNADVLPNLNALSYFQPDGSTKLTLTLDSKPEDTVYYPSAYGVFYDNSKWSEANAVSWKIYLQYPGELKRLKKFCEQTSPPTLADASDFIQQDFEEHTVYDYEPGPTPDGKDFAEYFMFDNQRGFCVHFATAATLMYRMWGFPARYVQGYAVPASAFERQEDGRYTANVTGEMGHAWCEVFAASDEAGPSLVSRNDSIENGTWIIKEHTLSYHGARPQAGMPAISESGRSWTRNTAGWGLLLLQICAAIVICLVIVLLLFFALAALRRQYRYRQFHTIRQGAGIRRMYCAIYDTAVFQGMDKTDILSPQGFQMLRDYFPQFPSDSLEWLYQTVLETMFYQKTVTKEDTKHAWNIYREFSHMVRKNLSPSRKFIYLYIKVL